MKKTPFLPLFFVIFTIGAISTLLTPQIEAKNQPEDDSTSKTEIMAHNLLEYAQQAGKIIEKVPQLESETKAFINDGVSLIACIKNDIAEIKNQLMAIRVDQKHKVSSTLALLDKQLIPLINNLALLALSCAQVLYVSNTTIIEPFNPEVSSQASKAALTVRELVKEITQTTKELSTIVQTLKKK